MRALVQRVSRAAVSVAGETIGSIGPGLLVLVVARLRVFADDAGKMNLSVSDVGGGVLAVSQFTLYGDVSRGNRPGFTAAAPPEPGEQLVNRFVEELRRLGVAVETGRFGAHMDVSLVNDGPVTIWIDSAV
jgi:D-tyrosyl-tRNA(Tyr) deacylase